MLSRRSMFGGLASALAMPAIIRTPGLLMPVKRVVVPVGPRLVVNKKKEEALMAILGSQDIRNIGDILWAASDFPNSAELKKRLDMLLPG